MALIHSRCLHLLRGPNAKLRPELRQLPDARVEHFRQIVEISHSDLSGLFVFFSVAQKDFSYRLVVLHIVTPCSCGSSIAGPSPWT